MTSLYLLAFLCLLALVVWIGYVVISGLFVWPPPIPTRPKARRAMIGAIRALRPEGANNGLIFDPGCGFGSLALALAKAFPEGHVVGIDLQPIPLFFAGFKARLLGFRNVTFKRGDLYEQNYRAANVIACYLYGNVMEQLQLEWDHELQDGCVVATNLHTLHHWTPTKVISVTNWPFSAREIYLYRFPEARGARPDRRTKAYSKT